MTSARKTKANRGNAQASTGPKTVRGKAHAAQNARRHGLNLSAILDPVLSEQVKAFTREIAGEAADDAISESARRIAEAQIDLQRVRQAKLSLLTHNLSDPEYRPDKFFTASKILITAIGRLLRTQGPMALLPPELEAAAADMQRKPEGSEKFALILRDCAKQLLVMDRYER
jgi:hypothetical protein